jgi:hypothetical protein
MSSLHFSKESFTTWQNRIRSHNCVVVVHRLITAKSVLKVSTANKTTFILIVHRMYIQGSKGGNYHLGKYANGVLAVSAFIRFFYIAASDDQSYTVVLFSTRKYYSRTRKYYSLRMKVLPCRARKHWWERGMLADRGNWLAAGMTNSCRQ